MSEIENPVPYFGRDLNTALGIEIDSVEQGVVTGRMPIVDAVRQPYGVVHGGAHAAFAESLASAGTYMAVATEGKVALGMTNSSQFLTSPRPKAPFTARPWRFIVAAPRGSGTCR